MFLNKNSSEHSSNDFELLSFGFWLGLSESVFITIPDQIGFSLGLKESDKELIIIFGNISPQLVKNE